jgi:hypothetical protein
MYACVGNGILCMYNGMAGVSMAFMCNNVAVWLWYVCSVCMYGITA